MRQSRSTGPIAKRSRIDARGSAASRRRQSSLVIMAGSQHLTPAGARLRAMPSERESLTRAIGTFGLAAGIINITIGGGIFRLPAIVAASLGAAAPIAYLVCAIAMGLIVTCIANAGSRVSLTGGPYAYVEATFGPFAGFISGVLLWMLGTF